MYTDTPKLMLEEFRARVGDTRAPYFWSDPEIYSYMDEGQSVVATRTLCIQDTIEVNIAAGSADVALSPSIIRIRGALLAYSSIGEKYLDISTLDAAVAQGLRLYSVTGRPNVLFTDTLTARLYPIPSEDGTLRLLVHRLPVTSVECGEFEVIEQYRPAILDWMRVVAYLKNDAETFSRDTSRDAERDFERRIDMYLSAESKRRGGQQNNPVAYGGL